MAFAGDYTPLSNLYPCRLLIDDNSFNSSEQYFQHQKCLLHDDPETAGKVMAATTPRDAMRVGNTVKSSKDWILRAGVDIMRKALSVKMDQVPDFANFLHTNKGKTFIECSRNPLWGCGLPFTYDIDSIQNFKGKNLMGELLSQLVNTNLQSTKC